MIHLGVVEDFEETRGLGTVRDEWGRYPFHCTAISDGTRRIAAGTPVCFVLVAGHGGSFEASSVTKLDGGLGAASSS